MFTKKDLLDFLFKAHKNTYVAPKEVKSKNKVDSISVGHKDYEFSEGDWKYHDSYAGWYWPPGKEIVYYKNEPVWCMSYQGKVKEDLEKELIEEIYSFLKEALRHTTQEMPFRGPISYSNDNFEYLFYMDGNWEYFVGKEIISYKGEEVFFQDIMGSLIK